MRLIVGLGNPEPEYVDTRHNAGFLVIDKMVQNSPAHGGTPPHGGGETQIWKFDKKANAEIFKTTINKKRVLLAKPLTYMNNSGTAVRVLMDFYKLKPENLIVIHDDKDIPLGETRMQTDRGPAGHNGVKSIIEHLGTQNFMRIRVGVAPINQTDIKDTASFVLGKFTAEEKKKLKRIIENVAKEIETLV